jgi:hypothetical protein
MEPAKATVILTRPVTFTGRARARRHGRANPLRHQP